MNEPRVNVLLVDDRPENLVALESILADLGQNLVRAHSGREALRHLLNEEFAVILMDVQMPELDGYETARLIRSREKSQHIPIVFLTAINTSDVHVVEGYSVGAVDYVTKPFSPAILKAKVGAFVELARKKKQLEEEIRQRQEAEEEVRKLNAELERRVEERTAALRATNRQLKEEIVERRRAEEERERLLRLEQAARAEAEAAQKRLSFLCDASTLLSHSLEYETTLERVVQLAVPYLADFCIADLAGDDGEISRIATAHADPAGRELMRELQARWSPDWSSPQPAARVFRSGKPELVSTVTDEWLKESARTPEHLCLLRKLRPASYLVVPLLAGGRTIGVISFGVSDPERRFGEQHLVLAEDLARRAAAAIDNARMFREIQEAGRRKDEFLAMLAHELRNPLAAISNAVYVVERVPQSDPTLARAHAVIGRQTRQLARMVDDLLDISRITRGKVELRKEAVDLASIIQRSVEAVGPSIEARQHDLTVSVPREPVWLDADPARLEQVLGNLLQNAAKYTEPGGKIGIAAERRGEQVEVRVTDSGIGIPPDLLPRVFELFTQAERSLDRSQGGLGIGLALVKRLVQMHGGSVSAHSDGPGRGSEFTVRLPLPAGTRDRGPRPGKTRRPKVTAARATVRTLVVDDNVDSAETLTAILRNWGHEVRVVHEGSAAIAAAVEYRPDVVLLDIGLPGMDGYTVARRLREWERSGAGCPAGLLLIALTGYGQEADRRRSTEAGFDVHLTKPIDPEDLRRFLLTRGRGSRESAAPPATATRASGGAGPRPPGGTGSAT